MRYLVSEVCRKLLVSPMTVLRLAASMKSRGQDAPRVENLPFAGASLIDMPDHKTLGVRLSHKDKAHVAYLRLAALGIFDGDEAAGTSTSKYRQCSSSNDCVSSSMQPRLPVEQEKARPIEQDFLSLLQPPSTHSRQHYPDPMLRHGDLGHNREAQEHASPSQAGVVRHDFLDLGL